MKKKMRRFDEGGLSKAQEDWLGGADRSDPYIMARMRKAVPDEPKAAPKADAGELRDETGMTSKMRRNTETGELYSTDTSETKTVPKATSSSTPKAAPKAEAAPASKAESKAESKSEMGPTKKTTVAEFKESLKKGPEMPGSFSSKKSADTEKKAANVSEFRESLKNPLKGLGEFQDKVQKEAESMQGKTSFAKKLREKAGITSYKAGGKVSSASSRGDGCAMRGKTRGRIV